MCLRVYGDSDGSDQPAHPGGLIRVFPCQLKESVDTTECINGDQRPRKYFAHVQDGLNQQILRILEGTFCLTWPI